MKSHSSASVSPITLAIEAAIRSIPAGKISTYGRIARMAGLPNGARQVVRVLHARSRVSALPWYRILAQGKRPGTARIALGADGFDEQRTRLLTEGVEVAEDGTVDFLVYGLTLFNGTGIV